MTAQLSLQVTLPDKTEVLNIQYPVKGNRGSVLDSIGGWLGLWLLRDNACDCHSSAQ